MDLIHSVDVEMRELSRLIKEMIHPGALEENSTVYIHKIDSQYNLWMYSRIGRRNPLHSTAIGKVLLAWRDAEEVKESLREVDFRHSTVNILVPADALPAEREQVKEQGFGEDRMKSRKRGCAVLPYPYLIVSA